jgi:hypothetical protein
MAFPHKPLILILAATLAVGIAGDAFARAGGFSFGSRGGRTFSAPSATPVAPRAAPMERSMSSPNDSILRRPAPFSQGGSFSGGFGRGLLGGFIGAALFDLLFGHGLFGGLGGGLSILGLLLQIGLLFLLFKFVMGFVRGRRPAFHGTAFDSSAASTELELMEASWASAAGREARGARQSSKSPRPISACSNSASSRSNPHMGRKTSIVCAPWRRPENGVLFCRGTRRQRQERPSQQVSFARCSTILAATVLSRAVAGSSAIKSSGLQASAIAIATRWRWPPDNSCG